MNVACPQCKTVFRVDPRKVGNAGVRARCSICGGVFEVGPSGERGVAVASAAARPASSHEGAQGSGSSEVARRGTGSYPPSPAVGGQGPRDDDEADLEEEASDPSPPASDRGAFAATAEPEAPSAEGGAPPDSDDRIDTKEPPRRPAAGFAQADPEARSRRLARALISDMVAYHPERQDVGLREGRLKELFREEIKKAWREYVDQVGLEIAKDKPYFRDALNEILARGKTVF